MPSDTGDRNRRSTKAINTAGAPPPEQQQLPCPRCDSTNTKFCYYNNYNFSQPRHFCKSCRRYWTRGGTLRDIPVGGGTRRNAKPSRTTHGTVVSSSSNATTTTTSYNGFASLLNSPQGPGYLALVGSGLVLVQPLKMLGSVLEEECGLFRWQMVRLLVVAMMGRQLEWGNQWQFEGGEAGPGCFSWPELAISNPGNSLN